jgi:hypothetical protein
MRKLGKGQKDEETWEGTKAKTCYENSEQAKFSVALFYIVKKSIKFYTQSLIFLKTSWTDER